MIYLLSVFSLCIAANLTNHCKSDGLCVACHHTDTALCALCDTHAQLVDGVCRCADGFHQQGHSCLADSECDPLCSTCDPMNGAICYECVVFASKPVVTMDTCGVCNACKAHPDAEFKDLFRCQCEEGYYPDSGACKPLICDPLCEVCDPAAPSNCSKCKTGATLTETNECACGDGFHGEGENCVKNAVCDPLCSTCDIYNGSLCYECIENASKPVLEHSHCGVCAACKAFPELEIHDLFVCQCDEDYFFESGSCVIKQDTPMLRVSQ